MDRRDFLKKAFQVGGLTALYSLGAGAVQEAMAIGILPAVVGSGGEEGISWATWTEDSQSTLASDDIFCCFFDSLVLGGNDTGEGGGLSGANPVLTQVNNVPAASEGYRQLTTASQQYFTWTTTALDTLIKDQAEWTVVLKIKDWSTRAVANDPLIDWQGHPLRTPADSVAGGKWRNLLGTSDQTTTDGIPNTGVLYFCLWRKAGAVWGGFKDTRPTAESDFIAARKLNSTDDSAVAAAFTTAYIGTDTARWATIKLGYLVVAKTALFS